MNKWRDSNMFKTVDKLRGNNKMGTYIFVQRRWDNQMSWVTTDINNLSGLFKWLKEEIYECGYTLISSSELDNKNCSKSFGLAIHAGYNTLYLKVIVNPYPVKW